MAQNRTQTKPDRSLVTIRPATRKLLDRMCQLETRTVIDQMEVVIREAAERRGIIESENASSDAA